MSLPTDVGVRSDADGTSVIRTPRLVLAAPRPEHAEAVLRMARDPEIARWNPLGDLRTAADAEAWCARNGDWSDGSHATFVLLAAGPHPGDPEDPDAPEDPLGPGAVLGNLAVHSINHACASAEVGYRVVAEARGRGIAGEALRAAAAWAFAAFDLTRLELAHAVGNPASCTVAERAGFRHEGTLRLSYRYGDGLLHDEHVHGRLATDILGNAEVG